MIPVLTPIRFYDPNLTYGSSTVFQNPDNRVSPGYNYNGVYSMQYYTPIPKQWPDGQPGIDFLVNESYSNVSAKLYDEDDEFYCDLIVEYWGSSVARISLNGNDGDGVADGLYTIKLYDSEPDLIYESEALIIADWFTDWVPFEYWNFENDFGLDYIHSLYGSDIKFTGRMLVPIIMQDPAPEFEKEVYKNDPGVLTTLRTTMQRVFNFESLPVPVHVAEQFIMAFANSELYLNRIKINTEDAPEGNLIKGTNMKEITGKCSFVNFNENYERESVETSFNETTVKWASSSGYANTSLVGDTFSTLSRPLYSDAYLIADGYTHEADEVVLIKINLTEDDTSDLPTFTFSAFDTQRPLVWGDNWVSVRFDEAGTTAIRLKNNSGENAIFTAVITLYSLT